VPLCRTVPGYWRFDLRAGYLVSDHIELSVNVNNAPTRPTSPRPITAHYATIAPGPVGVRHGEPAVLGLA
jgi:catecholate siderophore receptor